MHSRTSLRKVVAFSLFLPLAAAHADIITGKVTDLATKAPLAGVTVTGGIGKVLSGADGSYSLNTEAPTGVAAMKGLTDITWDASSGAFRWDAAQGRVSIEVRNIAGKLLESSSPAAGATAYRFGDGAQGLLLVSVRSAAGSYSFRMNRVGSLAVLLQKEEAPGRAEVRSLLKMAATTKVSFTFTGYDAWTQNVTGSKTAFDVPMNKIGGLPWRKARLTWYTSYPDPNSEECIKYNGCTWAGQFAALGKKPESWVAANNLIAVHSRDFNTYKLKTFRLKYKEWQIDAQVVDMCSDSDCNGCCTQNANTGGGFLIDLESYGVKRFGLDDGQIEWACLNCT